MAYPVDVSVEYGDGVRSRGLAVLGILFPIKMVLAIPHFFLLYFIQIGVIFAAWFGYSPEASHPASLASSTTTWDGTFG